MSESIYSPSLILGTGNQGVQALRFIKAIAEELDADGHLLSALKSGRVQLVGIDLDPTSNVVPLRVKTDLLHLPKGIGGENVALPELHKRWVPLDGEDLMKMVQRMGNGRETLEHECCADDNSPFPTVEAWFPKTILKNPTGYRTQGQTSNFTPWRPLGRLALFQNMARIVQTLRDARDEAKTGEPLQALIICALADGIGSGTFIDLAYILRRLVPDILINALFLIEEGTYEDHHVNTYAALREVMAINDGRREADVVYPISHAQLPLPSKNLRPVFESILVFESKPAPPTPSTSSKIDLGCFQVAQVARALIQREIYAAFAVTGKKDHNRMKMNPVCAGLLGTSNAFFFHTPAVPALDVAGMKLTLEQFHQEVKNKYQRLDWASFYAQSGLEDWVNGMSNDWLESLWKKCAAEIGSPVDQARKLIQACTADLAKEGGNVPSIFVNHFGKSHFIGVLRDGERVSMLLPLNSNPLLEACDKLLKKELGRIIDYVNAVKNPHFQAKFEENIDELIELIKKKVPESQAQSRYGVTIPIPEPLKHMADFFSDEDPNALVRLFDSRNDPFKNDAHKALCKHFLIELDICLDKAEPASADMSSVLLKKIPEHRDALFSALGRLRDQVLAGHEDFERHEEENRKIKGKLEYLLQKCRAKIETDRNLALRKALAHAVNRDDHEAWAVERADELLGKVEKPGQENVPSRTMVIEKYKHLTQHLIDLFQEEDMAGWIHHFLYDLFQRELLEVGQVDELYAQLKAWSSELVNGWRDYIVAGSGLPHDMESFKTMRIELPPIFAEDVEQNLIKKRWAYLSPFGKNFFDSASKERIEELAQNVRSYVSSIGVVEFEQPSEAETAAMMLADLYRNPQEIRHMDIWSAAYRKKFKNGEADAYHTVSFELPKIPSWGQSSAKVLCGNDGCDFNIGKEARSLLLCPGCSHPIWNRCGNLDCQADGIKEQIDWDPKAKGVPKRCPACRNPLKTYWWSCSCHGTLQQIPMDKTACPKCLEEVQEGKRQAGDISKRPNQLGVPCIGCSKNGLENPFLIPLELVHFVEDGVNGHDLVPYHKYAKNVLHPMPGEPLPAHCQNSPESPHILIPTCPMESHSRTKFLYRLKNKRFACNEHPEARFWTCSRCDYPLLADRDKMSCPRCLTQLYSCTYCSSQTLHYYLPHETMPGRCPSCLNRMLPGQGSPLSGLENPANCPNIYGCLAGRDIEVTATEFSQQNCRSCPGPKAPLFLQADLLAYVDHCPLCRLVVKGHANQPENLGQYLQNFKGLALDELGVGCPICGSQPGTVLRWIMASRDLEAVELEPLTQLLAQWPEAQVPAIPFLDGLSLLEVLFREHDDAKAYAQIKDRLGRKKMVAQFDRQRSELLRVFPPNGRTHSVLSRRLKSLGMSLSETLKTADTWSIA